MKRLKFERDEIDIEINELNGTEKQTGRLKKNKMPVRCCEDCGQWMLLAEYPTSHRTWICKVCQGLAKDPDQHAKADVGYKEYLKALSENKRKQQALWAEYLNRRTDLLKEREAIVEAQHAKYGRDPKLERIER